MRKILIVIIFVVPGLWLIVRFQTNLVQSLAIMILCLIFAGLFTLERRHGRLPPTYYVVADDPGKATKGEKYLPVHERKTGDRIMELSTKAEQRGFGRELGGKIYIRFDCGEKYNHWDYDQCLSLEWLVRNGAQADVFVSGVGHLST